MKYIIIIKYKSITQLAIYLFFPDRFSLPIQKQFLISRCKLWIFNTQYKSIKLLGI